MQVVLSDGLKSMVMEKTGALPGGMYMPFPVMVIKACQSVPPQSVLFFCVKVQDSVVTVFTS